MSAVDSAIFEMVNEGVPLVSVSNVFFEDIPINHCFQPEELDLGDEFGRTNSCGSWCGNEHCSAQSCPGAHNCHHTVFKKTEHLRDLDSVLQSGWDAPQDVGRLPSVNPKEENVYKPSLKMHSNCPPAADSHLQPHMACSTTAPPAPTQAASNAAASPASPSEGAQESRGQKPKSGKKPSFWSKTEHEQFLEGLRRFGGQSDSPDAEPVTGLGPGVAELISMLVGTRSVSQVRSHAQKYFIRLAKQRKLRASEGHEA